MRISLIVAMAENGVIGKDGGLPWHLPADLKHFKATTMGKPLIMGRKTYESIGKPLPGRAMIVITRRRDYAAPGITVVHDWAAAVAAAQEDAERNGADEAMVIGGAEIYAVALEYADRLYVTEIHTAIDGDTVFPDIDRKAWRETSRRDCEAAGGKPAYSLVTLERRA